MSTSSAAGRRLAKEYADIQNNPIENVKVMVEDDNNILNWTALIQVPKDAPTPYRSGNFKLSITMVLEYPFKAPVIKFETKIYHPNVNSDGAICLSLIKADNWKPSLKMSAILQSLVQLLYEPNPEDPLEAEIAKVYLSDRPKFDETAAATVKQYAAKVPPPFA